MAEAHTIHVDIVSAEGELFSGDAKMVFAPASQGELGIAPRHAPLLTLLKAGEVRVVTPEDEHQSFFVGGGALEIQPNKVTVLADTAARAKDLDEAAALEAKQRAEEALRDKSGHINQAEALAELVRLNEQLKLIQRLRNRRS
ncbi:MAG TPA: F0F1 ATP synthase subunit epsilon [Steroidobacteraceae bacterium]|nr:F0F1 ATP synthase subunit epsilon [Steroidobacteraceae bacterium]